MAASDPTRAGYIQLASKAESTSPVPRNVGNEVQPPVASRRSMSRQRSEAEGSETRSQNGSSERGEEPVSPTGSHRSRSNSFAIPRTGSLEDNEDGLGEEMKPETGLEFIEGSNFQNFIGIVIFGNILVLWGETDAPGLVIWTICDHSFLVIFVLEFILRLMHFSPHVFFNGPEKAWGWLDFSIVMMGIFDLWLTPILARLCSWKEGGDSFGSSFLRCLRLMRLFRLLRLFQLLSEMRTFANSLMGMGEQFLWIFAVLTMTIFCSAIILTHLLGHGEALGHRELLESEWAEEFDDINSHFGDVWSSAFTLFQITTADNWADIAVPILKIDTRWRFFFYAYISFASWFMISVLTAVASNSMFETTSLGLEAANEKLQKNKQRFVEFLRESFVEADEDGNGVLDKDEFSALMEKDFVHEQMRALGVHLTEEELYSAWDTLDYGDSGELTIEEFVYGLSHLQEGLDTKHIVNVDYGLKRTHGKAEEGLGKCKEALDQVLEESSQILERMKEQGKSQHQQQLSFWLWQQWAQKNSAYRQHVTECEKDYETQKSRRATTGKKSMITESGKSMDTESSLKSQS